MQIDLGLNTNTQERKRELKFLIQTLLSYVRVYLEENRLKVSWDSIKKEAGEQNNKKDDIITAVKFLNLLIPDNNHQMSILQKQNEKGAIQAFSDYVGHNAFSLGASFASVMTGQDHIALKTKKFIIAAKFVYNVEQFVNEIKSKDVQNETEIRAKLKALLVIVNDSIKDVENARGRINKSTLDDLLIAFEECITNALSDHDDYKQIIKYLVADIKLNSIFKAKDSEEKKKKYIERSYALFTKTLIRIYLLLKIDKTNRDLNAQDHGIKLLINIDEVHRNFSACVENQINLLIENLDKDIDKKNQIQIVAGNLITDVSGYMATDNPDITATGVMSKVSGAVSSAFSLMEYLSGPYDNKSLLQEALDALIIFKKCNPEEMLEALDNKDQTDLDNSSDVISVKSPAFSNENDDDIEISDKSLDENKNSQTETKSTSYARQIENSNADGASPKSFEEESNNSHDDQNEKRDGSSQITTASESGDNASFFSSVSTDDFGMRSNDSILSLSGLAAKNEHDLERNKKINSSLKSEQLNMALSEEVIKVNKGSILGLFNAVKNNKTAPTASANSEKKENIKRTKSKNNNKPGS